MGIARAQHPPAASDRAAPGASTLENRSALAYLGPNYNPSDDSVAVSIYDVDHLTASYTGSDSYPKPSMTRDNVFLIGYSPDPPVGTGNSCRVGAATCPEQGCPPEWVNWNTGGPGLSQPVDLETAGVHFFQAWVQPGYESSATVEVVKVEKIEALEEAVQDPAHPVDPNIWIAGYDETERVKFKVDLTPDSPETEADSELVVKWGGMYLEDGENGAIKYQPKRFAGAFGLSSWNTPWHGCTVYATLWVVKVKSFRVVAQQDCGDYSLTVSDPNDTNELYIPEKFDETATVKLQIPSLLPDTAHAKKYIAWKAEGASPQPPGGTFEDEDPIVELHPSDGDRSCTFHVGVDENLNGQLDDDEKYLKIVVHVCTVESVWWETYDPNPPLTANPNAGGGKRIFSGQYGPTDTIPNERKKVYLKARITPPVEGITVHVKDWDIDDPSSAVDPIDGENPTSGPDNRKTHAGFSSASAVTDDEGEVSFVFSVSTCPGDNYRVAASVSCLALLLMTQEEADSGQPEPRPAVVLSEMLTVWRKVWTERDTMAAVITDPTHIEGNVVRSDMPQAIYDPSADQTMVIFQLTAPLKPAFTSSNQFEGGKLTIPVGGTQYDIVSSSHENSTVPRVYISGNIEGSYANCLVEDEDDNSLLPQLGIDLGIYADEYERAYVVPTYLSAGYSDEVDFELNLTDFEILAGLGWNDEADEEGSSLFRTVLVVAGFQSNHTGDLDPDGFPQGPWEPGGPIYGASVDGWYQCVLFLETMREKAALHGLDVGQLYSKCMAHEMGHALGADHDEDHGAAAGIMGEGLGGGDFFTDYSLDSIRDPGNW